MARQIAVLPELPERKARHNGSCAGSLLLLLPVRAGTRPRWDAQGVDLLAGREHPMPRMAQRLQQQQRKPTLGRHGLHQRGLSWRMRASTCALVAQRRAGSHVGANGLEHLQLLIAGAALLLCTVDARLGRTAWSMGSGPGLAKGPPGQQHAAGDQ
jgi:hypothetical protein